MQRLLVVAVVVVVAIAMLVLLTGQRAERPSMAAQGWVCSSCRAGAARRTLGRACERTLLHCRCVAVPESLGACFHTWWKAPW